MIETSREVGPYVVKQLTVREGLKLMSLAGDDEKSMQTELILLSVTKDGQPIGEESFRDALPHLPALVTAAVELNGLSTE